MTKEELSRNIDGVFVGEWQPDINRLVAIHRLIDEAWEYRNCFTGIRIEQYYTVEIPNAKNRYGNKQRLCYSKQRGNYFFCGEWEHHLHAFTKTDLEEAGFGWVFTQGFAKEY